MNRLKLWFYRCRIRWLLPCRRQRKNEIMTGINTSIDQYFEANPNAASRDIQANFGTPQQIVVSCVDQMPQRELINYLHFRRKVMFLLIAAAVLFFAIVFIGIGIAEIARFIEGPPTYYHYSVPNLP